MGPNAPVIPTTEALEAETLERANSYAVVFQDRYGIEIDASRAVGLDAANTGGEPNTLASTIAPVPDTEQFYEDGYQVFGYLSVEVDAVEKVTGLPVDAYLIACPEESGDCLALPANGEKVLELKMDFTTLEESVAPTAFYETGSVRACWRWRRVRYCTRVF